MRICGRGELTGWRLWVVVVAGTAGGLGLVVWTASGWSRAAAWLLAVWGAGLVLASLLTRTRLKGLGFFRTVVFLPQVVAMVVLAVAWRRIYAPDGLLNSTLRARGGVSYGVGRGKSDGGAVLGRTPGEGAQS